jgi:hypothetical protein
MTNPFIQNGQSLFNPNQFEMQPLKGDLAIKDRGIVDDGRLAYTVTDHLIPGTPVKIADTSSRVLEFVPASRDNDPIYGFTIFDIKKNSLTGGDYVNVASTKTVMYMEASEAIPKGHALAVVIGLTSVQVTKWVTGKTNIGFSLDQATAANQIIRVQIETPAQYEVVSS